MKKNLLKTIMLIVITCMMFSSCSRKSGCPSNGKNVGAERLMSGEKVPKAKKFKA